MMNNNKIIFSILIIGFIIVSGTASAIFTNSEEKNLFMNTERITAKWTVMYYMCGDSNMDSYISPLLDRLSIIGSSSDLNIIVLKDNIGDGNSKLYYIAESGEMIELNDVAKIIRIWKAN